MRAPSAQPGSDQGPRPRAAAFTLIELLVSIAIIALLILIALPGLSKARKLGLQTREYAAAQQLMTAFQQYADANKGRVLVGYPSLEMLRAGPPVLNHVGERLDDEEGQRYPWRLAPYLSYDFRGVFSDPRVLAKLKQDETAYTSLGKDYGYIISLLPSLGMNTLFIGGSDKAGAFSSSFTRVFGRVHVERIDEPVRPSQLMVFMSARCEPQPGLESFGRPEGYFRVEPPIFAATTGRRWASAYEPLAEFPGLNSGFVSLRHGGKAVCAYFDGHAGAVGWDQASDMRLWADRATHADWGITPR